MTIAVLFWLAVATVVYTWIGYPALLTGLARRRRPGPVPRHTPPRLSVVVAAYNEAACIGDKLRSTLDQPYPWSRLEVVVVSDGSTDGTDDIVAAHPDPRVHLVRQEPRSGKSVALNRGVAASTGDVLVFTDANALFGPDALTRLAAPFADPAVGLVSGQGLYAASGDGSVVEKRHGSPGALRAPGGLEGPREVSATNPSAPASRGPAPPGRVRAPGGWGGPSRPPITSDARGVANGYVRYEALLRAGEAALGCLAGADGAIYALRRDFYRELAGAEVNDLLHPLAVALAGARARFEPRAVTFEPPSAGGGQEFRRHARIIAQGVHLVCRELPRLVAARRWRMTWMLVSHRVLRWTTGAALAVALASSAWLARGSRAYGALLAAQALFYVVAAVGFAAERRQRAIGRLALPYYFCVVSAAGLAGIVRFLRSGAESVWAPTGQSRVTERAA